MKEVAGVCLLEYKKKAESFGYNLKKNEMTKMQVENNSPFFLDIFLCRNFSVQYWN